MKRRNSDPCGHDVKPDDDQETGGDHPFRNQNREDGTISSGSMIPGLSSVHKKRPDLLRTQAARNKSQSRSPFERQKIHSKRYERRVRRIPGHEKTAASNTTPGPAAFYPSIRVSPRHEKRPFPFAREGPQSYAGRVFSRDCPSPNRTPLRRARISLPPRPRRVRRPDLLRRTAPDGCGGMPSLFRPGSTGRR